MNMSVFISESKTIRISNHGLQNKPINAFLSNEDKFSMVSEKGLSDNKDFKFYFTLKEWENWIGYFISKKKNCYKLQ